MILTVFNTSASINCPKLFSVIICDHAHILITTYQVSDDKKRYKLKIYTEFLWDVTVLMTPLAHHYFAVNSHVYAPKVMTLKEKDVLHI